MPAAMDVLGRLAEAKIREAMERGEFDDLPMRGKPIRLDDFSSVPADLRVGYMILKRANCLPEELELRKEMVTLQDLITCCQDESERAVLVRRRNERSLHYRILVERRLHGSIRARYEQKLRSRFGL
jgi:hypothetical protein